ncbi:MAG: hypothetical protein MSQ05_08805 [Akkermansia sp.]|nr:hypothetical protein [Akkermansia sp.]
MLRDSDLCVAERERAESVLGQGERVLRVWRPCPASLGWREVFSVCLFASVPCIMIWLILSGIGDSGFMVYLFLAVPVIIAGSILIGWAVQLRKRMLLRRSFCLLTEGRILAFRLSLWGKPLVSSWTLENVISLDEFPDGSGCLVIGDRTRYAEDEEEPEELIEVPNVSSIKDIIQPYLPKENARDEPEGEPLSLGQWIGRTIFICLFVLLGLALLGISLTMLFNTDAPSQSPGSQNSENLSSVLLMGFVGLVFFLAGFSALLDHLKSGRPRAKKACQKGSERV